MKNIFWTAYTNEERHLAIRTIQQIVDKYGDIVDFKQFSDIALTMLIEIQECEINELYQTLSKCIGMESFDLLESKRGIERKLYLNINFSKATGNLKVEIPAVPG